MRFTAIPLFLAFAGMGALTPARPALAQSQTQAAPSRVVGSVTAISGSSLTVKPDTGAQVTFTVSSNARILETQPGAKTLVGATPIQLSGVAVGDRVLAALQPGTEGPALTATTIICMKQAALTQHQQAEEADWEKRGVGGLVKTIDPTTKTITIASGSRILTIHTTPQTVVRRYSTDSIKFADTRPSTLAEIHPGDQLRAKGDRSADGAVITADAIVAGGFRNIAGVVISINTAANTLTVKDLATKKRVVIRITPESRMHKLPGPMAQALAVRFKRGDEHHKETMPASQEHSAGRLGGAGAGSRHEGEDLSAMLQHAPTMRLSELHKGDAVMIVAAEGTPDSATAVTLLAGVEPILTASPSASQTMFSASWSLGGSGGSQGAEGAGDQTAQ